MLYKVDRNDFDLIFMYKTKEIKTIKIEFKYGVTSITDYPEIYSRYVKKSVFSSFFDEKKIMPKFRKNRKSNN